MRTLSSTQTDRRSLDKAEIGIAEAGESFCTDADQKTDVRQAGQTQKVDWLIYIFFF